MTEVTVPQAAPLQRHSNVELMHAGTWGASTGTHTFTTEDFVSAASASLDCPAVRRPILKLGHVDTRFDGEPCIGYIDNLRTNEDGHSLVGDYAGMPGWMTTDVLASAYPDRSIEGEWHHKCALGHDHLFVLTAVALLGVSPPAIGTLESFQDIATLYAVTNDELEGDPVPTGKVTVTASATPTKAVALSVSSEDIRRAYYDANPSYYFWVEEIQLSPELQLIVHDDNDNSRSRVPVIVDSTADGTDAVTFGEAVPVVIRYDDVAVAETVAATRGTTAERVVFASREASRTDVKATQEEPPVTTLSEAVRDKLGITDTDADDEALIAALTNATVGTDTEAPAEDPAPVAPVTEAAPVEGTVTVDAVEFAALRRQAALGATAHERLAADDRGRYLDDAVRAGKFPPARRAHYDAMLSADPEGGKAIIDSLAPGLVPVNEQGHNHGEVSASAGNTDVANDPRFLGWKVH
jgi:hypothetical protein